MNTISMIVSHEDLKPKYGTDGAGGFDLRIASDITIAPGATQKVGTGLKIEIPKSHIGLITPRSSCVGLVLQNVTGVVDSDYQGEVFLKIKNESRETQMHYRGDRLFQMIIVPVLQARHIYVKQFKTKTARGENGFGSTGTK